MKNYNHPRVWGGKDAPAIPTSANDRDDHTRRLRCGTQGSAMKQDSASTAQTHARHGLDWPRPVGREMVADFVGSLLRKKQPADGKLIALGASWRMEPAGSVHPTYIHTPVLK